MNGVLTKVVGDYVDVDSWPSDADIGDGGLANEAHLVGGGGFTIGFDGSIFLADFGARRIRHVSPDGIISTTVGTGSRGYSGDGGSASQAQLQWPADVTFDSNGNLYIADLNGTIRLVTPDGIITTIAGTGAGSGSAFCNADSATSVRIYSPRHIAIGSDGSHYFSSSYRICRVTPDGAVETVVGTGSGGYSGDGGPADQASVSFVGGLAFGPDGSLYFADSGNDRTRRVGPSLPGMGTDEYLIPADNSNQLFHFDATGRHLRTFDTTTGAVIQQFRYDTDGHLSEIEDAHGNITRIERSGAIPTAIVAPDGQRTGLPCVST